MAFLAMILNTVFCIWLLGRGVNELGLTAMLLSCTALLMLRYITAKRVIRELDVPLGTLKQYDRRFRAISFATQLVVGAGIWIVWPADNEARYVMTLLICFYATGTMVNLSHDYRSVLLTLPVLMVQPVAFWTIHELPIAVILVGLTALMISSVRNSQRTLEETIRIRFEKDDLLAEIEREKETALRALKQAEIANRSKSFFMAAASHDLRQPLYAATLLCETLTLHNLPHEAAQLLKQQRKALGAAAGLFDNLLDLSKFESGAVESKLTSVSLDDVLRDVDSEYQAVCRARGLTLEVGLTGLLVRSDYDLLTRMVRNLVSNAAKYTTTGGVRLLAERRGHEVLLAVEDTGPGIPIEDRERIFDEFVQIGNRQRLRDRGVGLGLAIVRHISLLLDHPVSVDSRPGGGTRMTIRMPAAVARAFATDVADAASEVDLSGREVWIVEDDPDVRQALVAYFNHRRCSCEVVQSRSELEGLASGRRLPDFALFDDMLSESESGLDLARWLANRLEPRRILIMTGNINVERWGELQASGFEVLRKPISVTALDNWMLKADAAEDEERPTLKALVTRSG